MAQAARQIVTEVHDEPHLEGRRVTVRRIQGLVEGAGKSAQEVADQFNLDVADVYAALQYYHTHPAEMVATERAVQERETAAREAGGKALSDITDEDDEGANDVSGSG